MNNENIGISGIDTGIGSAGVGFVVVPEDIDREQYIKDCYRTNTLTINGGRGYGFLSGVHADINVMQNISFPDDEDNRGTAVVWVRDSISQLPVIVGVLRKQDDYYSLAENQFRLQRGSDGRSVEIFIDANTSSVTLSIIGDEKEPSDFNVNVSSVNKDSVISISCDNEMNLFSEKKVNVISNGEVNVKITEKGETLTSAYFDKEKVQIKSKQIIHSEGGEPMVLGDTLVGLLGDLISAITAITVPTPMGTSGNPLNLAEFNVIKNKLEKTLSKTSKLD